MKGIIFSLLEQVVVAEHGDDTWDDLLDAAGVDGVYTSLGNYPDAELVALVDAAATRRHEEPAQVVRWFGRRAIPLLAGAHPAFFAGHGDTTSFLLTLNDVIHAEVRKIYPDAQVPVFGFKTVPGGVDVTYRSARRLCSLAEGFIEGASDHFGERVAIEQPECMEKGADRCLIQCRFSPA